MLSASLNKTYSFVLLDKSRVDLLLGLFGVPLGAGPIGLNFLLFIHFSFSLITLL